MKTDQFIDSHISARVREAWSKKEREHSGRLSASMLGLPLQWQILQAMGCPSPIDDYTLRKFQRGSDVENWIVGYIPGILDKQKRVEYRGCSGYLDVLVDTKDWDTPVGEMPIEVKSVTNAKFKRINTPDRGHLLQAAYYALGLTLPKFAILYVASDDYRIKLSVHDTEFYEGEINTIIDNFNEWKSKGEIPPFEPIEKWQADSKYQKFPAFASLSGDEAKKLLEKLKAK